MDISNLVKMFSNGCEAMEWQEETEEQRNMPSK